MDPNEVALRIYSALTAHEYSAAVEWADVLRDLAARDGAATVPEDVRETILTFFPSLEPYFA